jgi:hypothetical protein
MYDIGLRKGSHIAVVHNTNGYAKGANEKMLKMRKIYNELGRYYGIDGEDIFDMQNQDKM